LESLADHAVFDLLEAHPERKQIARVSRRAGPLEREVLALDLPFPSRENAGALDQILELADISREIVSPQIFERVGGQVRERALLKQQEVLHEGRNVLPPLAQRHEPDRKHVEAVVEI